MKRKLMALAALLGAGLFTACSDNGLSSEGHIAAVDALPRYCDELDTVRLSTTGALFYCNNGDWIEVGAVIPKKDPNTADKTKPTSSSAKANVIQSSNNATSSVSAPASSSQGSTRSSSSAGKSSSSSAKSSGSTSSSSVAPNRDKYFAPLDGYVTWSTDNEARLKSKTSISEFTDELIELGYQKLNTDAMINNNNRQALGKALNMKNNLAVDFQSNLYYKLDIEYPDEEDSDEGPKMTSHFVAGIVYQEIEVGSYDGNIGLLASAITAQSYTAGDMWNYENPNYRYRVKTYLDNGTNTSGYWWYADDHTDGGTSSVIWPAKRGTVFSDDTFDPVIDYCHGLCGTAVLSKTKDLFYDPFVVIAFHVAGQNESSGKPDAANATTGNLKDGFCITYSSDLPISLAIGLGEDGDKAVKYDNPMVTLPQSEKPNATNTVGFQWSDFVQAGWGVNQEGQVIDGETAAKQIVSLKFTLQRTSGIYNFNIIDIHTGNNCD